MNMIILKYFIPCLILSIGTGALSGLIISGDIYYYTLLDKPPLSPPPFVFPVVWTVIYILIGIAHYIVHISHSEAREAALKSYYAQLLVNFLWPILFFKLKLLFVSAAWIILLIVLTVKTAKRFSGINKTAGTLFVPYIVWLVFAAYLNIGVWALN